MLAQISPAYDLDIFKKQGLVKVRDRDRQTQKILKLIDHALSTDVDVLLFPELAAPFSCLEAFESALRKADRDFVANICYEHTYLDDMISILSEEDIAEHALGPEQERTKLVNFCRIFVKAGPEVRIFTQMKLTPFSTEFSLSARETLLCGKILHRFVTNWGNFLFLICKDYVGEVTSERRRVPMFDFLKSLTDDGLHYIFVSALNTEQEAFVHAARAFYYMQERSGYTFSLFLNTAELNHTTVVFPVRPHPKIRTSEDIQLTPLFQGKPGWGTQLRFPGCTEKIVTGTFVRLDRYQPMPTKEIFSPIFRTDTVDISELGIETDVLVTEEAIPAKETVPRRPLHNLPSQPTSFVGREEELTQIKELLDNPSCRLLTLVGPGGIGKTRLALEAVTERIGDFAQGVYFVPLAPLSSADFVVSTIAKSLGLSFRGPEDPKAQLLNYLREKEMLLVMDNFEHLVEGSGLVAEILEAAGGVKIVVTSRERLNLKGEWILGVPGMELPDGETLDAAKRSSAVQLFVQNAQRVCPKFAISQEQMGHVVRICQLVGGMPLGIELASSWTRVLSCGDIASEVERNLDFLATSMRDVPERHRSMRAVFEQSWDLLSEKERDVFMKMSVFRGSCTRDAAQKVAGASLFVLSTLVDKSLLHWNPAERYEVHELLRQYAEEKLRQVREVQDGVQSLHSHYYAELLQDREQLLKGEKEKDILEEVSTEMDNVRTGWYWAVTQRDHETLAQFLETIFRFYVVRGLFQEGEQLFQKAVDGLQQSGAGGDSRKEETVAKIRGRLGVFAAILSDYARAQDLLQGSLDVFRRCDVRKEMAFSLRNLGFIAQQLGEYTKARELLEESFVICTQIDDKDGIATSVNSLGLIAYGLGEYEDAKRLYQDSLAIRREIGDRQGMTTSLINRGNVAYRLGEYDEARKVYQEGLSICDEIGDQWGAASALNNLGNVAYEVGDYEDAQRLYEGSLSIKREIGHRKGIAFSLGNLGEIAHELGDYGRAKELHQEMLAICQEIGSRTGKASARIGLGRAALALGIYEESKEHFLEALRTTSEIRAAPLTLDVLVELALLLRIQGEKERSFELLASALRHPAIYKGTRDKAEPAYSELASELASEVVAAIEEKNKARELQDLAEEVLREAEGERREELSQ